MRILITCLFIAFPTIAAAQVYDRDTQTDLVKRTIGTLAAKPKPKLKIVTRDMRRLEGKLVGVYGDYFMITPKQQKPLLTIGTPFRTKYYHLKYRDVLQLEAKRTAVSFVPDPTLSPYGKWDELTELEVGVPLQIILEDNTRRHGVLLLHNDQSIKIMRGNTQVEINRGRIAKMYKITGNTTTLSQKLIGGVGKGTDVADDVAGIIGSFLGDPRAHASPLGLAIGAAIGAAIFLLPDGGNTRVLVYAR
jgi:hypothetical protein